MSTPVALITGAAHRLGAETAKALHKRGWNLVIHYRSRADQARALVEDLNRARSDSATCVAGELTNPDDVARVADVAVKHWGRLDGLINNASVFYPTPTETAGEDDLDLTLNTNLKAPFFLLQHCLPALRKASGTVVNMIDIYSERPLPDHPLYCASKAGLAALTRSWARELAPQIRVNGVSPGAILWPEGNDPVDESHKQAILDKTALARTGSPADIAGAITYLMCDAPFVTGQILPVDGGRSLNM